MNNRLSVRFAKKNYTYKYVIGKLIKINYEKTRTEFI